MKRNVPFSVYMTAEEKKEFEKFAQMQGRSLAAQFRFSLQQDVDRYKQSQKANDQKLGGRYVKIK